MRAVADEHGTPRQTMLVHDPGEIDIEDLIDDEDLVVTLTSTGYIKSVLARSSGPRAAAVEG